MDAKEGAVGIRNIHRPGVETVPHPDVREPRTSLLAEGIVVTQTAGPSRKRTV
jgi:hypothetical protein